MRTNIDIDDDLLAKAMHAGPFTTKKETVEAGLRLLARHAAYREILKWKGKLKWEGDESIDWTQPDPDEPEEALAPQSALTAQEPRARYKPQSTAAAAGGDKKAGRRARR
ncbi:type II toxin-antitoxin system VapB family antitoxin [Comamonas badia]|uniref:type II toxin-antitoxin system VapB family antitoxin n=1 Tax=Comamonas badia TaxID=265291 RepID=UPI0004016D16|nr:type II toxin-antitoxin system VapB family antitoxin [Comamonas badia]